MKVFAAVVLCLLFSVSFAQTSTNYSISFDNAEHHEAQVTMLLKHLDDGVLSLRMSRTSPGRYALHEFAKNVYSVEATDENGKTLTITRPNPYQWDISGHKGTVKVSYTLFANFGDGTYAQIDESHAHLNIPATFMFAKGYEHRPIELSISPRQDLDWKVATQLKKLDENRFYAPDLDYFIDSPIEISNHRVRSFEVGQGDKKQRVEFVLHQNDDYSGFEEYMKHVQAIVEEQAAVFGEYPSFDYGRYTFLACYMPQVDGDGMEHRNSTILTTTRALAEGGLQRNIGTVSHEFFHAWNVERLRPRSLEPFDYENANMSGALWFAEGFTSYYTTLIMVRAGVIDEATYVDLLASGINQVVLSPGRTYFNPIEMSYQAPFVDAATSVDPVNRNNTFISYYTYGKVLGLGLDLSLRTLNKDLDLDGYMKLLWKKYGKNEIPYSVRDLEDALNTYAGKEFSQEFFENYVYNSKLPDYRSLLETVGIELSQQEGGNGYSGLRLQKKGNRWYVGNNPRQGGPSYEAGLTAGDRILSVAGKTLDSETKPNQLFKGHQPGDEVTVKFQRFGKTKKTQLKLIANPNFKTSLKENPGKEANKSLKNWLESRKK